MPELNNYRRAQQRDIRQGLKTTRTFVLEGSASGSVTSIPMKIAGGTPLTPSGIGVPVAHAVRAIEVAVTLLSDAEPGGDITVNLRRRDSSNILAPSGVSAVVESFTLSI